MFGNIGAQTPGGAPYQPWAADLVKKRADVASAQDIFEELAFESNNPQHFLARCSRHGVVGSGGCLLEKRVGEASLIFRFPRAWLDDWHGVAKGIDTLMARLQGK